MNLPDSELGGLFLLTGQHFRFCHFVVLYNFASDEFVRKMVARGVRGAADGSVGTG